MLIFLTSIFFISCDNTKTESKKSEYEIRLEKDDQLDSINQNETSILSKKFNALSNEDTTIKFTYQIQEEANKYNRPISVIGDIKDVALQDSNYALKIYGEFANQKFFAEILVSEMQFQELKKQLNFKSDNEGCFIFNPTTVKSSSMLTIDSEVSTDDDAETVDEANANASSDLTYDFGDVLLFFKGNLISFYLYKQLKNDED